MQRCQLPVFRSSTTTANLNNSASLYTRDVPGQPKKTKTKNLYIRFWKNKRVVQKKIVWCWRRRRAKVEKEERRQVVRLRAVSSWAKLYSTAASFRCVYGATRLLYYRYTTHSVYIHSSPFLCVCCWGCFGLCSDNHRSIRPVATSRPTFLLPSKPPTPFSSHDSRLYKNLALQLGRWVVRKGGAIWMWRRQRRFLYIADELYNNPPVPPPPRKTVVSVQHSRHGT